MRQGSTSLGILGRWTNLATRVTATTRTPTSTRQTASLRRRLGGLSGTSWAVFLWTPSERSGEVDWGWTRSASAGGMGRSSPATSRTMVAGASRCRIRGFVSADDPVDAIPESIRELADSAMHALPGRAARDRYEARSGQCDPRRAGHRSSRPRLTQTRRPGEPFVSRSRPPAPPSPHGLRTAKFRPLTDV